MPNLSKLIMLISLAVIISNLTITGVFAGENDTSVQNEKSVSTDNSGNVQITAYYFHGTRQCVSCKRIEAYSKEAIENGFSDELADGIIKWKSVDFDKSENNHYKKDYRLFASSLVIVKMINGEQSEWKNLEKVWKYKGDKEKFHEYVQEEIREYLEGS
ncbi:MAG: hypothetical protein GF307_08290 [candidate division Zixibacteria bacterium]|nr:hypothetical protein [candidate division Zixibacteria bacterium]